jgi:hypothetical protein
MIVLQEIKVTEKLKEYYNLSLKLRDCERDCDLYLE